MRKVHLGQAGGFSVEDRLAWVQASLREIEKNSALPENTAQITFASVGTGTMTTGTARPDPNAGRWWQYINGGAHTLAPSTNLGEYYLDITNNASAGVVTVSGWTKVTGAFTTTNGHKFRCRATVGAAGSLLEILALQ